MKRPPPRQLPASRIRLCGACGRRRRMREVRPDVWECPCRGLGAQSSPAQRSYVVDVCDEDIAKGRRGSPRRCAVARAVKRSGLGPVAVTGASIVIPGLPRPTTLALLSEIEDWISAWDAHEAVRPFRFRIELGPYQGIVLEDLGVRAGRLRRPLAQSSGKATS